MPSETEKEKLAERSNKLSQIRITRGVVLMQQTKLKTYEDTKVDSASMFEIETRLQLNETYFNDFDKVQRSIEILNESEVLNDKRDTFTETFCYIKAKLLAAKQSEVPESNLTFRKKSSLPHFDLPKFSGRVTDWTEFYNMFETLVHKDDELSAVEKFQHLKTCLSGSARQAIQSLEVTAKNYPVALELLKKRFENKRLIFEAHITNIFKASALHKSSAEELRKLNDEFNAHLRALQSIASDVEIAHGLLIHLICQRLDSASIAKWEEEVPDDGLPTWDGMSTFLSKRCQALDNLENAMQAKSKQRPGNTFNSKVKNTCLTANSAEQSCLLCKCNHNISNCSQLISLDPYKRYFEVKRMKLCVICLKPGHPVKRCKAPRCRQCQASHHTLLHMSRSNLESQFTQTSAKRGTSLPITTASSPAENSCLTSSTGEVQGSNNGDNALLGTAIIQVRDKFGNYINCRAVLDSASQSHFITERVVKRLQLDVTKLSGSVGGIGSINTPVTHIAHITVKSRINDFAATIDALVLPKITEYQPQQFIDVNSWKIPPNLPLADIRFNQPQRIDLLIGVELFFDLLCIGQIKLGKGIPTLQKTLLGWIIAGGITKSPQCYHTRFEPNREDEAHSLETLVQRFWDIERHDTPVVNMTHEEINCEEHFCKNTKRLASGRLVVRLPFRDNSDLLGSSFEMAKRRFLSLERKLSKLPEVRTEYSEFLKEYLSSGHMIRIDFQHCGSKLNFLPHHYVMKPDSSTTKLRVVFDASARTSSGLSLNNVLMVGPKLQDDLFELLLRFRTFRFVVTADISKMFRQVMVDDKDSYFQCIIWRESPQSELQIFRLTTVTYGTAPASYLAIRSLHQLADEEEKRFPIGAQVVRKNLYMDDLLAGSDSIEGLLKIRDEVNLLLRRGGFLLRKWCANDIRALEGIAEVDKEQCLRIDDDDVIKTLGLIWQPQLDEFRFSYKESPQKLPSTMRTVLSDIARMYDPIGLISPVIAKAKIFMQGLWKIKLSWDESLPTHLHELWRKFRRDFSALSQITTSRYIALPNSKIQVHGFCDASSAAYGACIYIRSETSSGKIIVRLLCAKSKIAPLKTVTIPRLELCAALLLSQLLVRVKASSTFYNATTFCWTDSSVVLTWLQNDPSRWSTFVANRVAKIQRSSDNNNWRHVPTVLNPADIVSRGASPLELCSSNTWFEGPNFLYDKEVEWPTTSLEKELIVPEGRPIKFSLISNQAPEDLIASSRYANSYSTLIRVFAYVFRFLRNAQLSMVRIAGPLSIDELKAASRRIIWLVQRSEFFEDYTHLKANRTSLLSCRLKGLSPFLDAEELIRVGGRLQHANISFDAQHPILLPSKHCFTRAVIRDYHYRYLHAGQQTLLAIIRNKYWIINGRSVIRKVLDKCIVCCRAKPKSIHQIMGILPSHRVQLERPFTNTGVDFCGPFTIRYGVRGRQRSKAYICLFVCLAVKAVHLEVVSDLTTQSFLMTLKRFISRRGKCTTIYSDNATNFVGARNEMMDLHKFFNSEDHKHQISEACRNQDIDWKFIPPRSPHFGGLWESSIKLAKHHLRRIMGYTALSYEELTTVACQIEAIINSRPITPLSPDPNDLSALTPAHFLIFSSLTDIVEPDYREKNLSTLNRWERHKYIQQHFWSRWSKEYLQLLQQRIKWKQTSQNIKVGTMVLLKDDNIPSMKWKLGRVVEVHRGPDELVRVVSVRTANGICSRAITKVSPLPIEDGSESYVSLYSSLKADAFKVAGMDEKPGNVQISLDENSGYV